MGTGFWKCIVSGLIVAVCMTLFVPQPGLAAEPGTLKWSYQMWGSNSSPAIGADRTVYVGSYVLFITKEP